MSSDANDFKYAGVGAVICDEEQKKVLAEESLIYECAKCGYRYDKHVEHFKGININQNKEGEIKVNVQNKINESVNKYIEENDNIDDKAQHKPDKPDTTITKNDIIDQPRDIDVDQVKLINRFTNTVEEKGTNTEEVYVYHENLYQFQFTNEVLDELSVYKSIITNVTYEKHITSQTAKASIRKWLTTLNVLEAVGSLIVLGIVLRYVISVVSNQFETLVGFSY